MIRAIDALSEFALQRRRADIARRSVPIPDPKPGLVIELTTPNSLLVDIIAAETTLDI